MPEPRLMAVITALLMLAGTSPVRAGYDLDQLRQIEALILAKDCGALWEYLVSNPSIMTGEKAADHILGQGMLAPLNLGPEMATDWEKLQRSS